MKKTFLERFIKGGIIHLFLDFFDFLEEYEHLFLLRRFFSVKSFFSFVFPERFMILSPTFSLSDLGSIDGKVEIVMEDNSNREVRFIRKQTVIKTGEFTSRKKGSSIFNIFRSDEGGDSKITSPEDYMDNNLPSSLQEYFMFTGERLTQFFNKKDSKVKEGVHILYQLDLLDGISNEARKRETTFSNKLKKINPEL